MRRPVATATALAACALALAACSSSTSSDASASPSESMVGGMTECTKEAVQPAVDQVVQEMGAENQMPIDDLQCADGWAVAGGILGPKDAPADGPQGAPTTLIFQQEGQFWVYQDKTKVCGSDAASSAVPAALFEIGCMSG